MLGKRSNPVTSTPRSKRACHKDHQTAPSLLFLKYKAQKTFFSDPEEQVDTLCPTYIVPREKTVKNFLNEYLKHVSNHSNLRLRKYYGPTDSLSSILNVDLSLFENIDETDELEDPQYEISNKIQDSISKKYFLLLKDDELIGAIKISIDLDYKNLQLDLIEVKDTHRGCGYGEILFYATALIAGLYHCKSITVDSKLKALAFYKKMGAKIDREALSEDIENIFSLDEDQLFEKVMTLIGAKSDNPITVAMFFEFSVNCIGSLEERGFLRNLPAAFNLINFIRIEDLENTDSQSNSLRP